MKKTITEIVFETQDDDITLSYVNGKVTLTSKMCYVTSNELAILHQAVLELEAQKLPTQQDHCLG